MNCRSSNETHSAELWGASSLFESGAGGAVVLDWFQRFSHILLHSVHYAHLISYTAIRDGLIY